MTHQDVEVKAAGHAQAPAALQQRMKQRFIIENHVARVLIRQQLDEAFGRAELAAEHRNDELDVLSRELNPAVGLNQLHSLANRLSPIITPRPAATPFA